MKALALIPARGGSKRIPRKNIRVFSGRPIIVWTIETIIASGAFDYVVASTDDVEIAAVAKQAGARVPFIRPPALSGDHVGTREVICHALDWHEHAGIGFDLVACVYPTAVLLRPEDLSRGIDQLLRTGADFAVSVVPFPHPVERALRITEDQRLRMVFPEHRTARTQDFGAVYFDAGQFYLGRPDAFRRNTPTLSEAATPVVIPPHRVQDIDTEADWQRAEMLFRLLRELEPIDP